MKLYDIGYQTVAINALFQLADVYSLEPIRCENYAYLSPVSDFMRGMLDKWTYQYEGCIGKKISIEDYGIWLDGFYEEFNPKDFPKRYRQEENGAFNLIEPWEPWCLSQKLKRLRKSKGLTQAELGNLVGVTEPAIRSYEQAKRLPKGSVIEMLAGALDVTPEFLIFFDFGSSNQAVHAIFQIAKTFGLRTDIVDGEAILRTRQPGLERAIDNWADAFKEYDEAGDLEKYLLWQDTYDDDHTRRNHESRYRYVFVNDRKVSEMESDYNPYDPTRRTS